MPSHLLEIITVTVLPGLLLLYIRLKSVRQLPGPFQWPIIGNTLSVPKLLDWNFYSELNSRYGPIYQIRLFTDNFVVISDPRIAEELLGRRAHNYSGRRFLPFCGKYRSSGRRMLFMSYGPDFLKQRTAMQVMFKPENMQSNRDRLLRQSLQLLIDFQDKSKAWDTHLKHYATGLLMGIVFGMPVELARERSHEILGNTDTLSYDLKPGAWFVDMLPWLDKLPDFLSPWRATAKARHATEAAMFGLWASEARTSRQGALTGESVVAQLWDKQESVGLDDKSIAYVGGSIVEAGSESIQCALACFLYACTLYPDVVKRAQEELDQVVGDRLPQFSDFENLPYLFALVKESLRWAPITPLGIPHLVSHDDNYEGLHIPGHSMILTSIWNMHRNADYFPNPDTFDPLRFFKVTDKDKLPHDSSFFDGIWSFGIGRRVCPAQRLAMDSVWIAIVYLLWTFDITGDGSQWDDITPNNAFGFLRWRDVVNLEPKTLPLRICLRSEERAERLKEAADIL